MWQTCDVGEDSGGFEYFRLGFAQGRVPTEFDSGPSTTRRAPSNGTIERFIVPKSIGLFLDSRLKIRQYGNMGIEEDWCAKIRHSSWFRDRS